MWTNCKRSSSPLDLSNTDKLSEIHQTLWTNLNISQEKVRQKGKNVFKMLGGLTVLAVDCVF